MPPPCVIELDHLRKTYASTRRTGAPRVAIDDLSLRLDADEWVALLGPNGSGKSTLLRLVATLDTPDTGRITWFGRDNADRSDVRRRLGVVFQTPSLDALLTVRENLRVQAAVSATDRALGDERIEQLTEELRLADRLDDRAGALSGGLARRVDLARALLSEPEVLLLDEPTAGLDLHARQEFLNTLARRRERGGVTIVMSTHLMSAADRADRVVMMDLGRVVADGAPDALCAGFANDGVVLRTPIAAREQLERLGLSVRAFGEQALTTFERADEAALLKIVSELTAAGVAVAVGPPTLADVYTKRTGRTLTGASSPMDSSALTAEMAQ